MGLGALRTGLLGGSLLTFLVFEVAETRMTAQEARDGRRLQLK